MKIGILGGSFDPVHKGHIYMAKEVLKAMQLDQVWLIPAGHSPNKDEDKMTSPEHRLAMCRLACRREKGLIASDFEIRSGERSYTYRTMEKLKAAYPEYLFYFIMGGDSLDYFDQWKKPERIAELAELAVVVREGFDRAAMEKKAGELKKLFSCRITISSAPAFDISSTEIRAYLKNAGPTGFSEGDFWSKIMDEDVLNYIRTHGLYGTTASDADHGIRRDGL